MLFPVFRRPRKRDKFGVFITCCDIPAAGKYIDKHIMLRKNPTTLIIDSRDRIGPLNYDTFSIMVSPPIVDATKVRLLFASIGVPLTSTAPYMYWVVRCPQLGIGVRSANGATCSHWQLIYYSRTCIGPAFVQVSPWKHERILACEHVDSPI